MSTHLVPLTGADCMLRAFDCEARRYHQASHVSQLVLRLGADFDSERLRVVIERVARAAPLLRAPVRRPFAFGLPVYDCAAAERSPLPPIRTHDLAAVDAHSIPDVFFDAINQPFSIRRGELLRLDLVRYDGATEGTDLALSWAHLLLDGTGSEIFVRRLDDAWRDSAGAETFSWQAAELAETPPVRERGQRSMAWQRHLQSFARMPTRSPAGPRRRVRQNLCYRLDCFSVDESSAITEQAKEKAGFLTPMLYYMAAAIRAYHWLFSSRGTAPESYVVPLPVNTRPKGADGAVFRTHVSLIWFQIPAAVVTDFAALLTELKQQRRQAIRDGYVENGLYAMDFARIAPQGLYANIVRNTLSGELCSFFFAYTGEFLGGMESFLGTPIRNGFHVPGVPPSPGSCAAFSLRDGRLNLTHVYQRGVFTAPELDGFHTAMRQELLRGGA